MRRVLRLLCDSPIPSRYDSLLFPYAQYVSDCLQVELAAYRALSPPHPLSTSPLLPLYTELCDFLTYHPDFYPEHRPLYQLSVVRLHLAFERRAEAMAHVGDVTREWGEEGREWRLMAMSYVLLAQVQQGDAWGVAGLRSLVVRWVATVRPPPALVSVQAVALSASSEAEVEQAMALVDVRVAVLKAVEVEVWETLEDLSRRWPQVQVVQMRMAELRDKRRYRHSASLNLQRSPALVAEMARRKRLSVDGPQLTAL